MRPQCIFGGVLLLALSLGAPSLAQKGRVEQVTVHSRALEGNLLGDSPDRAVSIYLPPGYGNGSHTRYPVLYLLHGLTANNSMWLGRGYVPGLDAPSIADRLIASGRIQPMILVMPDAYNKYGGSFYSNSSVSGNWEDFIVHELVGYVDSHYRTLARADSRAIVGHAMGGYGALVLAMKHPETYGVVYAMSPYYAGFVQVQDSEYLSPAAFDLTLGYLKLGNTNAWLGETTELAMAAAFSPDPNNPPYYVDLPYKDDHASIFKPPSRPPRRIQSIWARWLAHTPLGMVHDYGINLLLYRGVAIDMGLNDDPDVVRGARAYDAALTQAGIPHVFDEYQGNHVNRVTARFTSIVLPFVSRNLEGE
ncbi:MAG: alpha/beta hydrolase-fold protein [Deinococcales bacterium]